MTHDIATRETAIARLDPQALISKAIEAGAGIDTMERLVALAKDVKAELAREAWYTAMAEFQRTCPSIKKTKEATIATRGGGGYKYRYAPLDEIMSVIQPVMGPLGLSVSWRTPRITTSEVAVTCRVSHTFGHHEESGETVMPIVQADPTNPTGANAMQRVGIATTYAKRYALLGIIGLAPEDDGDGRGASAPRSEAADAPSSPGGAPPDAAISEPQGKRLWAIARGQNWTDEQVKDLLTGFGVNSTKEIARASYDEIINRIKAVKHPATPA